MEGDYHKKCMIIREQLAFQRFPVTHQLVSVLYVRGYLQ